MSEETKRPDMSVLPDWTASAQPAQHLWNETNASGDLCYNATCNAKNGVRKRCSSCKVICHASCINSLDLTCRATFVEKASSRDIRSDQYTPWRHHFVLRKKIDAICKSCNRAVRGNSREPTAHQCTWCKAAYHNSAQCFPASLLENGCDFGDHAKLIVAPDWIFKVTDRNSFSSSVKRSSSSSSGQAIASLSSSCKDDSPFLVKMRPDPTGRLTPLIVFLNPKSGGNQGATILRKFQYLLNPRQIFDLNKGGPGSGLRLFKDVPNLHVLACGGDGTAGWVMSEIDKIDFDQKPPIAVLPLGTGNDLARTIHWGAEFHLPKYRISGYTDEPVSKILHSIENGVTVKLDRWNLQSSLSDVPPSTEKHTEHVVDKLPLDVFNNYFSLGADAATALEFHESREANPARFNNRLKNKIFYMKIGGAEFVKNTWKDLKDCIKLECDQKDYSSLINEIKPHVILFLNIPSYSAGTNPWGRGSPTEGQTAQSFNDMKLEVIGLTTAELAALHLQIPGTRICQCSEAKLTTYKVLPMQVDGEPCRLEPSVITIGHRNQANMVKKIKRRGSSSVPCSDDELASGNTAKGLANALMQVFVISVRDYQTKEPARASLRELCVPFGSVQVARHQSLDQIRKLIESKNDAALLSKSWSFIDPVTAGMDRCFRIDPAAESRYFVSDIAMSSQLFLCDNDRQQSLSTSPTPDIEKQPEVVSDEDLNVQPVEKKNDFLSTRQDSNQPSRPGSSIFEGNIEITVPVSGGPDDSFSPPEPKLQTTFATVLEANDDFLRACRNGNLYQVKMALEMGADYMAINRLARTGLHCATKAGHDNVVQHLLANGPRKLLEMKDLNKAQTALHKAAVYKRRCIAKSLIKAGACPTMTDANGLCPRQLALAVHDKHLAHYLQSKELDYLIGQEMQRSFV